MILNLKVDISGRRTEDLVYDLDKIIAEIQEGYNLGEGWELTGEPDVEEEYDDETEY
jgi:hypothetical protein